MTNEEAIKKLSMLKMIAVKSNTDTEVAMVMAIKALENQYGLTLALEQRKASNEYLKNSVSELAETINILKDEIKRLKAEQPPKGHWEDDCICSVCHWMHEDDEGNALITTYDYCPVCGADMRGEQKCQN